MEDIKQCFSEYLNDQKLMSLDSLLNDETTQAALSVKKKEEIHPKKGFQYAVKKSAKNEAIIQKQNQILQEKM